MENNKMVACWSCNMDVPKSSAVVLGEGKNEFHFCSNDCEDAFLFFSVGQTY